MLSERYKFAHLPLQQRGAGQCRSHLRRWQDGRKARQQAASGPGR